MKTWLFIKSNCWKMIGLGIILLVSLIIFLIRNNEDKSKSNQIVFTKTSNSERVLYIQRIEGFGVPVRIARVTGSPAWSPNGQMIAVGCTDPNQVCIYSVNDFPPLGGYPRSHITSPDNFDIEPQQIIDLPVECKNLINGRRNEEYYQNHTNNFIRSISWANDNKRFAIICRETFEKPGRLCILSLNGTSTCWTNSQSDQIMRINWSPNNDELLLSSVEFRNSKIYLSDINGNTIKYLTDGWSPDWSRDGRQLIFLGDNNEFSDPIKYPDVLVISKDGSGRRVVYQNPYPSKTDNEKFLYTTFACSGPSYSCRLSWSSDGRYLIFDGNISAVDNFIMRLDIQTGEISIGDGGHQYEDPQWKP